LRERSPSQTTAPGGAAGRCRSGLCVRGALLLALLAGACFGFASPAKARARAAAPLVLTDRQLDVITAAAGMQVDVDAAALGPLASTTTAGSVIGITAPILIIATPPRAPARALGTVPAELFLAKGQASAVGAVSAHCSATVTIEGTFAFLQRASATTTTPVSATCLCAAFGIALGSN
jgi:hypothetical protein